MVDYLNWVWFPFIFFYAASLWKGDWSSSYAVIHSTSQIFISRSRKWSRELGFFHLWQFFVIPFRCWTSRIIMRC